MSIELQNATSRKTRPPSCEHTSRGLWAFEFGDKRQRPSRFEKKNGSLRPVDMRRGRPDDGPSPGRRSPDERIANTPLRLALAIAAVDTTSTVAQT